MAMLRYSKSSGNLMTVRAQAPRQASHCRCAARLAADPFSADSRGQTFSSRPAGSSLTTCLRIGLRYDLAHHRTHEGAEMGFHARQGGQCGELGLAVHDYSSSIGVMPPP